MGGWGSVLDTLGLLMSISTAKRSTGWGPIFWPWLFVRLIQQWWKNVLIGKGRVNSNMMLYGLKICSKAWSESDNTLKFGLRLCPRPRYGSSQCSPKFLVWTGNVTMYNTRKSCSPPPHSGNLSTPVPSFVGKWSKNGRAKKVSEYQISTQHEVWFVWNGQKVFRKDSWT